jgi:hypothetical protein
VFEFTWTVPSSGFQWYKRHLIKKTVGGSYGARRYQPLHETTGLFLTFADTPATQEDILTFANTYGCLGIPDKMVQCAQGEAEKQEVREAIVRGDLLEEDIPEDALFSRPGESEGLWYDVLRAMRHAVDVWRMVKDKKKDLVGLAQCIHWETPEYVEYNSRGEMALIAAREYNPEVLKRFQPGDVIQPAWHYVQHVVNTQLADRVAPRLLWGNDRERLGLYLVPHNLIGALWLQFAQALDGNKDYRQCDDCHIWFELSPQVARNDKRFCNDGCRSKAYRHRQHQAQQLGAQGLPIDIIAKEVRTEEDIVRGWLEKRPVHAEKRRRGRPRKPRDTVVKEHRETGQLAVLDYG